MSRTKQPSSVIKRHYRGGQPHKIWRKIIAGSFIVLAGAFGVAGSMLHGANKANETADMSIFEPEKPADGLSDKQFVDHFSGDYKSYAQERKPLPKATTDQLFAHIELSEFINYVKSGRHGQAATEVFDKTVDDQSGQDVDTKWLRMRLIDQNKDMRRVIKQASVISTSQAEHEGSEYAIDFARRFWPQTDVVTLNPAGNDGAECTDLDTHDALQEAQHPGHLIWNNAHLSIGGANEDGVFYYSSCSAPDLLADNPFDYGMAYRYWPGMNDIKDHLLNKGWNQFDALTAAAAIVYKYNKLRAASPYNAPTEAMQPGLDGTSFTTPHAAGIIAHARLRYPDLSAHEISIAALLAGEKITAVEKSDQRLTYQDNGRGLLFNDSHAGFGLLKSDKLQNIAAQMSAFKKANPQLSTNAKQTAKTTFFPARRGDVQISEIYIDDDFILSKAIVQLDLRNSDQWSNKTPLILERPDGTKIRLSVGRVTRPIHVAVSAGVMETHLEDRMIDAPTRQVLGTGSKGVWKIHIPTDVDPHVIRFGLQGSPRGGFIDRFLDHYLGKTPKPAHKSAPQLRIGS